MFEKLKKLVLEANETGIVLPLLYDNQSNGGSYTLTMFWISFNIAIFTLAGKVTGYLGGVDYSNALWLLGITGSFYLGKKFTTSKDGVTVEEKEKTDV